MPLDFVEETAPALDFKEEPTQIDFQAEPEQEDADATLKRWQSLSPPGTEQLPEPQRSRKIYSDYLRSRQASLADAGQTSTISQLPEAYSEERKKSFGPGFIPKAAKFAMLAIPGTKPEAEPGSVQAGIEELGMETYKGLTTPDNALAVGAAVLAPEIALPYFAKESIEGVGTGIGEAIAGENPAQVAKGIGSSVLNLAMVGGILKGGIPELRARFPRSMAEIERMTGERPVVPFPKEETSPPPEPKPTDLEYAGGEMPQTTGTSFPIPETKNETASTPPAGDTTTVATPGTTTTPPAGDTTTVEPPSPAPAISQQESKPITERLNKPLTDVEIAYQSILEKQGRVAADAYAERMKRVGEWRPSANLGIEPPSAPVQAQAGAEGAGAETQSQPPGLVAHWAVFQNDEPYGVFANEGQARMVASGLSGKVEVRPSDLNVLTQEMVRQNKIAPGPGLQRAHDLIDDVQSQLGGKISLQKARELIEDFQPVGAARKLFSSQGGVAPDVAHQAIGSKFQSDVHFLEAINATAKGRTAERLRSRQEKASINAAEQKTVAFEAEATEPGLSKSPVIADNLFEGDEFEINGQKVTVKAMEFDDMGEVTAVTLQDGPRYGTQRVGGQTVLQIEKGSLKQVPRSEAEFLPIEKPPLELAKPETVAEQKARLDREEAVRIAKENITAQEERKATATRSMLERAHKPLGGDLGSAGQGGLFVEPGQQEMFKPPTPGMTGLGAAVPSEFVPGDYVSNMFAAIDRDRAEMGKSPMPDTKRRSWDEDNQKALARMNRDPNWIPDLIEQVSKAPRPLLSWENAGMVWQRHFWKAEANNALSRIAQAFDDGRTADLESAKLDAARYEEKLDALDKAVGRNGTGSEAGRSLAAQKMAGGADFSLVEMRLQKRKANGGRPLSEAQAKEIQDLHDQLKAVEVREVEARQKLAASEVARALAETKSAQSPYAPAVLQQAERFAKYMDKKGEDALSRLKSRLGRTSAGVDPTILSDVAIYGASKLTRGIVDLAKWTDAMAADVGEWIREHAQEAFTASQKLLNDELAQVAKAQGKALAEKVKQVTTDLPAQIDAAKDKLAAKVSQGSQAIGGDVQKLFRAVVQQNPSMTARQVADVMHGILKESMPDITWQETADAISGRGQFWRPSQAALAKRVRDLKTQLRLIGHQIDVEAQKPLPRTGIQRDPMSNEALAENKRLAELQRRFGIVVTDAKTQLGGALQAAKTRLTREMTDVQARLDKGDFSPRPKRAVTPDPELSRLQTQKALLVKKFRKGLLEDELRNRSRGQKVSDLLLRIRREFVLSGFSSIGKLASYSAQEFALAPLKEAVGAGLSKLPGVRQIAERAPSEVSHRGAVSEVFGIARDYAAAFTKGIKDAKDTWVTGESELKAKYDPSIRAEAEFRAFFGTLHQMEKSPLIRFGFERSFRRRMEMAADRGVDVTDPTVQQRISVDAYQDALHGALIDRNAIVNKVNRFVDSLAEKSKTTGRTPLLGSAAKFVFRAELPVQHVPANYVARTAEYIFGLGSGGVKTVAAFRRGIETLEPAEADQIMRHLKSGSVGFAAMLTGFLLPQLFGGLWTPNAKKEKLHPGEIQVGPITARHWFTHEQVLNAAQFGATVRKIAETKNQGLSAGAQAALWGLADEMPYAREISDYAKAKDPRQSNKFWAEKAKGYVIPQGVSQAAELLDMNADLRTKKRKPGGLVETLETGIPGLRQNVPEKR